MKFAIACLSFVFATNMLAQSKPAADLIITNAKIWTGDKAHPAAQAVAVIGDRIVAVGSNSDVEILRGTATKTIDAGGKLLLPGFNDAHVHFVDGGAQLDSVQLNDATSTDEFVRRIAEQAKKTPKGEWIKGGDWDETKWSPAKLPTKDLIDRVTPDNPVFLSRYDGHSALANSLRCAWRESQRKRPILREAPLFVMRKAIPRAILRTPRGSCVQSDSSLTHEQRLRA